MSTTFPKLATNRGSQRDIPVITELRPPQASNQSYGEPMTKAEKEEMAELRETVHQMAMTAKTWPVPVPGNGNSSGAWGRTFVTITVVLVGWVFTALYIAKSTETEIRVANATLTEQLKEMRERFDEYRKATDRDLRIADEHYREMSVAIQSRGIRIQKP